MMQMERPREVNEWIAEVPGGAALRRAPPPMSALATPPLSLYVHFPWCVRKCPYCDFNSYTLHGELAEERLRAAPRARSCRRRRPRSRAARWHSVFFGGGTPSLFSPRAIGRVLESARAQLQLAPDAEVTLEANPGTIERGVFGEYRGAGVTRVSLGAQSFDAAALAALGRIHSPAETRRAAAELHAAGLGNFNLDLMYALPGQDVTAALRDLTRGARARARARVALPAHARAGHGVRGAAAARCPTTMSAAQMLGGVRAATRGGRLRAVRGLRLRARRPAVPAQSQLLELRGLPRRRRRRARQAHLRIGAGRSCARRSRASRAAIWRLRTRSWRTARSRPRSCRSSSCSMRCGCARDSTAELFSARTGLGIEQIGAPLALAMKRGLRARHRLRVPTECTGTALSERSAAPFYDRKSANDRGFCIVNRRPRGGGRQLRGFIHRVRAAQRKNE